MRAVVKMTKKLHEPHLLQMYIHGAPHRRAHIAVIRQYREKLREAFEAAKITTPIKYPVDLWLMFVDPCSPDYDNLLTALYQAMDNKTLTGQGRTPGLLADDGNVGTIRHLAKMYTA